MSKPVERMRPFLHSFVDGFFQGFGIALAVCLIVWLTK